MLLEFFKNMKMLQVKSLYRGMSSPLCGVAAINAITFGVYGNALRCFDDPDSIGAITLAGSTAGLIQVEFIFDKIQA